ncbi:PaaI family thioesterase [Tsuneonella sp. YG55]|uniref:PaaI family thioesterase n=1 Tax=Tsuneonella litorea TaxID=2976475 RepID=A0A9X2W3L9_9SPHN|nr:PaaI family thioesterase [Tsuneonella litorea]MCT2560122.1 PaaI family thioesterase [Tsuneonella litorea]
MQAYPDQFDPGTFAEWALTRAHPGWLGLQYRAHGDDWCELELPWRADLVGDEAMPVLASGPIVSLLDMAAGMAIWVSARAFRPVATLDLRVDYLRPSREHAPVCARVTCYRRTRTAAFVRGSAHDGDPADPVAQAAGVFMMLDPHRMVPA